MGVPAIANTGEEDVEIIQQFMNGNCVLVYGSPACLQGACQSFKEMLIGVAISQHSFCRRICFRSIAKIFRTTLSISVNTTNCFHRYESNTLSFLFSFTRLHKLQ